MIIDYIVGIGLDVAKDKILDTVDRKNLQSKLNDFIERQIKTNFNCTLEEEIDFEGLADYIQRDLIDDVQLRLLGNRKERSTARTSIINKAVSYSQEHTSLSRRRTIELTENAIDILRDFYKRKNNKNLIIVATQIEDTIIDVTLEKLETQTNEITNIVLSSGVRTVSKIEEAIVSNSVMSFDNNMQLMHEGKIEQVETNITNWLNAVGCTHKLFPDYCFDITNGTHQFYSKPLTQEAIQKYPSKISGKGTIKINDRYVNKFDCNTVDYANRHQLPITLNIVTAKKYLGTEIDPIQHEAEKLVGKTILLPPEPFPPAFPCRISLDDDVVFDYVLFRTQEIMDDGTVIISNSEQINYPFRIIMTANLQKQQTTYSINTVNPTNENLLQYLRFLKRASSGAKIVIRILSLEQDLAQGKCGNLTYTSGFNLIDDEIDFLEKSSQSNVILMSKLPFLKIYMRMTLVSCFIWQH